MTSFVNHHRWRYLPVELGSQIAAMLFVAVIAYLFKLPVSVVASGGLAIITVILLVYIRAHLGKIQIIGLMWFAVAALILCVLFVIREFVLPIRVTVLHIAVLLLPPLLLMKAGKKSKK